ncbi:hypothetical protein [Enterococcus sp. AZ112]|uniref:hypothetical protein n=1 Tax=Enterococcus sp. AZ112 TaxID=2774812 RepID=UPI003F25AB0D
MKEYELLEIEDMGFDLQTGKRNKARLYLGELETTENDVYSLSPDGSTSEDSAQGKEEEKSATHLGSFDDFDEKNPCENSAQLFNNSSNNLDTENLNTKIDTTSPFEMADNWQKEFLARYSESTFVPKDVLTWIVRSSAEWREAKEQLNMIYDSKRIIEKRQRKYNQKHGLSEGSEYRILGEIFAEDLSKTYQRCIQNEKVARHEGKEIQNRKGFYFKALLNFWECCARELNLDPMTTGLPEQAEYLLLQAKRSLFERLHIFSALEFEEGLKELLENDPAVNWRTVEREKIYPNGAVQSRLNLFEESTENEKKPKVKFTPEVL